MSVLNGVKYTHIDKWVTFEEMEELKSIKIGRNGCLKCESKTEVEIEGSELSIKDDNLVIENTYMFENNIQNIQISYCPFCGKKL